MSDSSVRSAAVVGGGVIGGGWVARFLLMGWDVALYDLDPEAERKVSEVLKNAQRSLPALYEHRLPKQGQLRFATSLQDAVSQADWVSECVPEQLELKQSILAEIQTHCSDQAIISSSTSGFKPSELQTNSAQANAERAKQIIVAHPFNPVYLVPLVELVGDSVWVEKAKCVLTDIGMFALHVRKEIDAHIADRLLEAVWREGLWLINDGVANTQEIDDAIRYGFGLRWAQMGLFETYRIAGGEAGMAHFIKQFGPALKWPWTKLMDVPELDEHLVNTIAEQSDAQSGQYDIRELERIRDDNLVSLMRGLKTQNWGAGELLNQVDRTLLTKSSDQPSQALKVDDFAYPITSVQRVIPVDWADYNKHMNESRYGQVFSDAADQVMRLVGADAAYIESGFSYFTVDTHIRFIDEAHAGDAIDVSTRLLEGDGKKLKLAHVMHHVDGRLLASAEQLLVHVDLGARKSCLPSPEISSAISQLATV